MSITDHGIHILPGESAAGTWSMAFGADDRLLVHLDDLTCGPIRAFDSPSEWVAMRQQFWDTICPQEAAFLCELYQRTDNSERPTTAERLHEAPAIYLWAGNNLRDQLSLMFSMHIIERAGVDPGACHRVPFEVRPHHNGRYISVGSCGLDELKAHPNPIRTTPEDWQTNRAAWKAVTSESPTALLDLLGSGSFGEQHILSNLLRRYPRVETGLSLWDRMLLERVASSGPNAAYVIAEVLCDTWDNGDGVGETYLFYRLKKMANPQTPKPLLDLTGNMDNCRGAEVTVTDFGRDVLEGRASAYPANPIDEWIGGAHLSSEDGNVWMYEGNTLRRSMAS